MLTNFTYNDFLNINSGTKISTKYNDVIFSDVPVSSKNPMFMDEIENKRNQLLPSDKIRRMKANLNQAVKTVLDDNNLKYLHNGLKSMIEPLYKENIINKDIFDNIGKFIDFRNDIDYRGRRIYPDEYQNMYILYESCINELIRIHGSPIITLEIV